MGRLSTASDYRRAAAFPAQSVGIWLGGAVLVGIAFVSAVAVPLATYTLAVACFGILHVGSELRYLDYRFGSRLSPVLVSAFAALLGIACVARLAGTAGWLPPATSIAVEVAAAAAMVAVAGTSPRLRSRRVPFLLVASLLACGSVLAPFAMLLLLSVTHNLTPLGFLAERLHGRDRRFALSVGIVAFVLLPAFVATGWPLDMAARLGIAAPEFSVISKAGTLDSILGAYVPAWGMHESWALSLFSACVLSQCMHYAAVLLVLPRLITPGDVPVLPWPRGDRFALGLASVAALMLLAFVIEYGVARKIYNLAALVHAWLEIPLLLIALQAPLVSAQERA